MPFLPGEFVEGTTILGLTVQNYNLLMGVSGVVCAGLIMIIWARSF